MKKRFSAYEIALSALSCAFATILLTIGVYSEILLFTGYLFAGIALMLPLAKKSYRGYALSYIATCLLSFLFNPARLLDLLPFVMFFGLHPLINELQLKTKINRWVACGIKALWFDFAMYFTGKVVFAATTNIPFLEAYILPILLVFGTAFFVFYDYIMYRWRTIINIVVHRIDKK